MVATNASRTSPLPSVATAFVAQDHRKKADWTGLQILGSFTAVIGVDGVTSQAHSRGECLSSSLHRLGLFFIFSQIRCPHTLLL